MDKWIEKQLSDHPLFVIIVVSSLGVAFLTGVGVLRPIYQLGQRLKVGSIGSGSGTKSPGVPAGSARAVPVTRGGGSSFAP